MRRRAVAIVAKAAGGLIAGSLSLSDHAIDPSDDFQRLLVRRDISNAKTSFVVRNWVLQYKAAYCIQLDDKTRHGYGISSTLSTVTVSLQNITEIIVCARFEDEDEKDNAKSLSG